MFTYQETLKRYDELIADRRSRLIGRLRYVFSAMRRLNHFEQLFDVLDALAFIRNENIAENERRRDAFYVMKRKAKLDVQNLKLKYEQTAS